MPSKTYSSIPEEGAASTKPLSTFIRLNKVVKIYEPSPSLTVPPKTPTTVLLCAWLNASAKHIDYYAKFYNKLWPGARIIVTTISTKQFVYESEATRRLEVEPVVSAILARPESEEWIHAHCLSNGGGKRLYNISGAYRAITGKSMPVKSLIMDSAPGMPQFRRDFLSISIPGRKLNLFLRVPFMIAVFLLCCVIHVSVYCKCFYFRCHFPKPSLLICLIRDASRLLV
jgi:hypothetical protein